MRLRRDAHNLSARLTVQMRQVDAACVESKLLTRTHAIHRYRRRAKMALLRFSPGLEHSPEVATWFADRCDAGGVDCRREYRYRCANRDELMDRGD